MFLLRETDRSVTEICLDVGFASLGTFSRTFRDDRRRVAERVPRGRPRPSRRPGLLHEGVAAADAELTARTSSFGEAAARRRP